MRVAVSPTLRIAAGSLLAALAGAIGYHVLHQRERGTPEALLERADEMSWLNGWIAAAPLYHQAELECLQEHDLSKALYARVSQVPAQSESSISFPAQIASLTKDLSLPEAKDPETRLRIQTILGMLEVNYDADMARSTWAQVETLARQQHHYLLASRAIGEQGIAAFLLGDISTAKKDVIEAWTVAKVADPAARVRYASVYGAGLVELQKYQEALGPLNEAIRVAENTHGVAYPTIAITSKIEALGGLGRTQEALALATEAMQRVTAYHLAGHLFELYQTRAGVYERKGELNQAIADYQQAVRYAGDLSYWRGLTQADGSLAQALVHAGQLQAALVAINGAIAANQQIPDELYFVPRNLAIKAKIKAKLGDVRESNSLYQKSTDMIDAFLTKVPTPTIERQLLADLSNVYAEYFTSLSDQGRDADAFSVIEKARGRLEEQAIEHHEVIPPHEPTTAEQRLTNLNLQLLNTDDADARQHILETIYDSEQQASSDSLWNRSAANPVDLRGLQHDLRSSELLLEYVLNEPQSYVLAITNVAVHRYTLPPKAVLERETKQYRSSILRQQADRDLAQQVFHDLLGAVPEYQQKQDVIVIPDGELHLLPFSALMDGEQYVLASHQVSVAPSGTVLDVLRRREGRVAVDDLPYLGVAAWTNTSRPRGFLATAFRAVSGPKRSELVALPASRYEVESIAADLPRPSTILLGASATETRFKHLPLGQYNVLHLALHGYADMEYPDRSALVFAPQDQPTDDGLLQVREIRNLTLNANLVTLSACDTGVGPVGQAGVANIVNAFIEAGAQSVVSALWELEDHATTQLMTVFYSHLGHHEGKAEALRQAQLEMLRSGAPPFYWASFELVGDPHGSLFGGSEAVPAPRRTP